MHLHNSTQPASSGSNEFPHSGLGDQPATGPHGEIVRLNAPPLEEPLSVMPRGTRLLSTSDFFEKGSGARYSMIGQVLAVAVEDHSYLAKCSRIEAGLVSGPAYVELVFADGSKRHFLKSQIDQSSRFARTTTESERELWQKEALQGSLDEISGPARRTTNVDAGGADGEPRDPKPEPSEQEFILAVLDESSDDSFGSGLLDLTRESDDTSLGAELLDEIYTEDQLSSLDQGGLPDPTDDSSGSGLLDLTREDDDTSLGAELLDEIFCESETPAAPPANSPPKPDPVPAPRPTQAQKSWWQRFLGG